MCKNIKVHPILGQETSVEVEIYSFFNLGARWGGWSTPRSGRFTSRETDPVRFVKEAVWAPLPSGRVHNISLPLGFVPRTVQPVS
jgi:hypothetical protein